VETQGMASDKKNAARLGAHIVFVDESGFLLIPPVRKTWGPRGQTPIIRHHQIHQRISIISGLSVSPKRQRLGLYYNLHEKNIQQAEVCGFLRHLLKHLRGPVIVVWDNARTHKGDLIRKICRRFKRLHLESLPPYAPELNPDEGVWSQAKNTLANGRPDTIDELWLHLLETLEKIRSSRNNLRACIHKSDLPLFLS
jgi:transposase